MNGFWLGKPKQKNFENMKECGVVRGFTGTPTMCLVYDAYSHDDVQIHE